MRRVVARFALRSRAGRDGNDRGALAPAVAILLVPLFALTGLVVDGSRYLDARSVAEGYAEEAARAGAMQIDVTAPDLELDPTAVRTAIVDFCQQITSAALRTNTSDVLVTTCEPANPMITDTALGNPLVVHAHIEVRINTWMLDIVGANSFSASADASAEPQEGVTTPDQN